MMDSRWYFDMITIGAGAQRSLWLDIPHAFLLGSVRFPKLNGWLCELSSVSSTLVQ